MNSELEVFNDPDLILAQTQAGISSSPLFQQQVQAGAVANIGGATGTSITIVSGGSSGLSISPSGIPGQLTLSITGTLAVANGGTGATTAAGARSNLGAAAKANPAIIGATIPLAKITGGGTDGSIVVNSEGIITGYTAPT